ncbi:polymerase [Nostoc minutum NIES-26]|uniref:Polymerase n=1 Tax=Nostoc minutum NIES-26 TaxID=1844469 RepID=A0A367Q2Q6_9NOSO|nr:polymerase [Nostoc minutum NIES-26]
METYLVYVDTANNSNKFWSAKVEGTQVTVQWGRVGYNPQTKVHSFNSHEQAIFKYHGLIGEKLMKGYRRSQSTIDSSCEVSEIKRAIELLDIIRRYVEQKNFQTAYLNALNQYLKIVTTPLGMQIDPYRVYQSVADVDHQRELLSSLLPSSSVAIGQTTSAIKSEPQTVSLKSLAKNFWRNI